MSAGVDQLIATTRRLRGPDGCPWDQEQTLDSLAPYITEESYELADAMREGDAALLKEELGDVLFQVTLVTQLAHEKGWFDMDEVAEAANQKMIRRHPHVFGDAKVLTSDEVVTQWAAIKAQEKQQLPSRHPVDHIPKQLPSLTQQRKLQVLADASGVAMPHGTPETMARCVALCATSDNPGQAVGVLLAELVAFCHRHHIDPEHELNELNRVYRQTLREQPTEDRV